MGVRGGATVANNGLKDPFSRSSSSRERHDSDDAHDSVPVPVPAGSTQNLPPGIYYGGICIGAPVGATCNPNAGGTCAASSTAAPTTVTMSGTYIIAGGGFYVCGNATVTGNGVLIYNTQDSQALGAQFGKLGQVEFNTNGTVDLHPKSKTELYGGFLIWQGKDPADPTGPNLDLATAQGHPAQKCDGRGTNSTDILLLHTANGLNSFEGTIYAPAPYALFTDQVSGTANLAVLTGCIYIAGADSTFQFIPDHLGGLGSGLTE